MEQALPLILFGVMSACLIGLSIIVVTCRSVFRGAIALTAALGVVAGLFALMGADFVAAGQLLIYVGGIMVIMLFVVMLSQRPQDHLDRQTNEQWIWAALFSFAVTCALVAQYRAIYHGIADSVPPAPTTALVGRLLLGDMVVPFEAVSLVLLAALVGAVYFGLVRKESGR